MKSPQKYLFLSFSRTKWHGPWHIRQKLMSEISKSHGVIYINPRKELRVILRNLLKIREWSFGIRRINRNLLLIESPICFPKIYKFRYLDRIIDRAYHLFIKIISLMYDPKCIKVLFIFEPDFSSVRHYYKKVINIYYPYDLFEKYKYIAPGTQKVSSADVENEDKSKNVAEGDLIKNVTLIYAVSDLLCDHYENKYGRRPKVLPNAVSDVYFETNLLKAKSDKIDNLVEGIPNTKIGYSGSLKGVLDLDIIIESAKRMPEYSFVFIGKIIYTNIDNYDRKVNALLSLRNVYSLGHVDISCLPCVLNRMDLFVIIYGSDKNAWTYYSDPAKLFEYMAFGKPIISTPHPVAYKYKEFISIVENPDQFISTINNIKRTSGFATNDEMIKLAKQNTWGNRAKTIFTDMELLQK